MGINVQIIEFKQKLAAVINTASIPVTVKDMILGDFRIQLQAQISAAVETEKQLEAKAKEEQEGGKEDGSKHSSSDN